MKPKVSRYTRVTATAQTAVRRPARVSYPSWGFPSSAVRFSGQTRIFTSKSARGTDAVRNFCPICGSLVFGGEVGTADEFTIYAGSLDDPSSFRPTVAIFTRNSPIWAVIPPDLKMFEATPS
jgi:hypothetical protein